MTGTEDTGRRRWVIIAVVGVVVVVAAVVLFLVIRDDGGAPADGPGTTATTAITGSTGTTATAPSTAAPPVTLSPAEAVEVVWPSPAGELRYRDALEAVRGFAEELAGFTDPVYGDDVSAGAGSGEITVRAGATGPTTVVQVWRSGDGSWWVLGAATDDIVLETPVRGTAIDDPLQLSGRARAFEGTVLVSVLARGATDPLGEGVVTGSGSGDLGPFEGEIRWENPGGGWGVVLLVTESAEDGRVMQATAIPVGFIGGD